MQHYPDAPPCPAPMFGYPTHAYYYPNPYPFVGVQPHPHPHAPLHPHQRQHQHHATAAPSAVDYAPDLRAQAHSIKPKRRPQDAPRKAAALDPSIDIYEDEVEQSRLRKTAAAVPRARSSIASRRTTLLDQPPQRRSTMQPTEDTSKQMRPTRRRVSAILAERQALAADDVPRMDDTIDRMYAPKSTEHAKESKKEPRRRTIYVPSEDTTVITIHPGASSRRHRSARDSSPNTGLDLVTLSEEEDNLVPVLRKPRATAPRESLATAPKRGPLRPSRKPLQPCASGEDVYGKGSGKENVPPGRYPVVGKLLTDQNLKTRPLATRKNTVNAEIKKTNKPPQIKSTMSTAISPTGILNSRKRVGSDSNFSCASPSKSLKSRANTTAAKSVSFKNVSSLEPKKSVNRASSSPFRPTKSPPTALRQTRTTKASTRLSIPLVVKKASEKEGIQHSYPVLSEDLTQPELYEDQWLSYQEVALTQLLNDFFRSASANGQGPADHPALRKSLLRLYHEPAIPLLHKRLQASLLYGALSIPKDRLAQTPHLKDDVGIRRKFLNLWLDTYEFSALRPGLEAIVGRELPFSSRSSNSSATGTEVNDRHTRQERRAIERFLDTFLIRHEDAVRTRTGFGTLSSMIRGSEQHADDFGSQAWSWRRTILRGLMLILLLDKAKSKNVVRNCLFQPQSPYKSSVAVLQAFAALLMPSLGDLVRPLSHLNYQLQSVQHPLQEYTYHINNLATDLRDGIILTRLIELLLYPQSSLAELKEGTVTVTLPTGDSLTASFNLDQNDVFVLSQQLKVPCISKTQKLYNVQVALAALEGIPNLPKQVMANINAEDIVDGHREKTLGLLWALVSKWGLGVLVDWQELQREINHIRHRQDDLYVTSNKLGDVKSNDDPTAVHPTNLEHGTRLLQLWAGTIAHLHGLQVTNLTTSFADGKVYEAIADEYLSFIPETNLFSKGASTLDMKLRSIGCSTAFTSLFASSTPSCSSSLASFNAIHIPSRDFTLATLAFLASRLLPLSRVYHATCVIQRVYRLRLARQRASQRIALMRLATHCATVVQTRERVVGAAVVLQKAWRHVLDVRIKRLVVDVTAFQTLARGYAVRAALDSAGFSFYGRSRRRRARPRVRGGW